MRDLFRRYLDSRIEVYRKVPDIHGSGKSGAGEIDEFAKRNMGARCLLLARSWNSPSADVASARTERDVRHHHDANGGR